MDHGQGGGGQGKRISNIQRYLTFMVSSGKAAAKLLEELTSNTPRVAPSLVGSPQGPSNPHNVQPKSACIPPSEDDSSSPVSIATPLKVDPKSIRTFIGGVEVVDVSSDSDTNSSSQPPSRRPLCFEAGLKKTIVGKSVPSSLKPKGRVGKREKIVKYGSELKAYADKSLPDMENMYASNALLVYAFDSSLAASEFLVDISDQIVDRAGMQSLRQHFYIRSDVINAAVAILTHGAMTRCYLPTYYSSKILGGQYNREKFHKLFTKYDSYIGNVQRCDKLYIPMNYINIHWYLCVINFVDEKVEIWDSNTDLVPEALLVRLCKEVVLKTWDFIIGFIAGAEDLDMVDWPIARAAGVKQQHNNWDCALHVIHNMHGLLQPPQWNNDALVSADPGIGRNYMASLLLQHPLNKLRMRVESQARSYVAENNVRTYVVESGN